VFTGKKTIIFDFDGTIADTFHLHETAFHQALDSLAVTFEYKDFTGISTKEAIRQILLQNGIVLPADECNKLIKQKQAFANKLYRESISFIPAALPFIKLSKEKGFKLAVASSGSRLNVTAGLQALQIEDFFNCVITADDVPLAKPDPAIFKMALLRTGTEAREALVIEDAPSGIQAAAAAGIDVVCIDKNIPAMNIGNVQLLVKDFSELYKFLEDNGNAE
jgi:HAD superfamily hydrolase (TIGR01509 family)